MENNQLQQVQNESVFSVQTFEHAQRIAKMLASSSLIPQHYQGRIDNVMIAMEMSNRMNISPLMVMQNLYIVKGNPGWSGSFVIATINNSNLFSETLKFEKSGDGDSYGYTAITKDKHGNRIEGTKVDWKMVKAEGWLDKPGSKWKTMPEQMFKYRAASFFGREHCPHLLMGMQTVEEVIDISHTEQKREEITTEELQLLLDEKAILLEKKDFDRAKEIIENKEVDSYKKLKTLLNSKTDDKN